MNTNTTHYSKTGTAVIAAAFILLLVSLPASAARMFRAPTTPAPQTLDSWTDVIAHANTPADICRVVKSRIRYVSDASAKDEWQDSQLTWQRRKGDCEDFAITVRDLCTAQGIKAEVVVFYPRESRQGHAVTLGEWNGGMWMSSNGSFERVNSEDDARERIARENSWPNDVATLYTDKSTKVMSSTRVSVTLQSGSMQVVRPERAVW